ncbi:response regulator [Paraferrimonas sp. SM1919]|uniref:response regulator n=1 Tax=Paraferrimonas sp. SM1919 TaxID=2662263 RepID=UPI0013D2B0C3|nr:response regulator [Paraferrimonas sp. SM1919]
MKKQNYQINIHNLAVLIILSTALIIIGIFYKASRVIEVENGQDRNVIISIENLISSMESINQSVYECKTNNNCQGIKASYQSYFTYIKALEKAVSSEKKLVNLNGKTDYKIIAAKLKKISNQTTLDMQQLSELNHLLSLGIQSLNNQKNSIISNSYKSLKATTEQTLSTSFFLIILIVVISISIIIRTNKSNKQFKATIQAKHNELLGLAKKVDNLELIEINKHLENTQISSLERNILTKVKGVVESYNRIKEEMDNTQHLYSLIGYEIRDLSNNLTAGMTVLTDEDDDKIKELNKGITNTANTLSELADNYNTLLSKGRISKRTNFSFTELILEISLQLKDKLNTQQKKLEISFHNDTPNLVQGQKSNLFWVLFLVSSNAIKAEKDKNLLFSFSSSPAQTIDKVKVSCSLTFLNEFSIPIEKLSKLHWSEYASSTSSKDNWVKSILKNIENFNSNWYISGKQKQYRISFEIECLDYIESHTSNLKGKRFLIYCLSPLSLSITSQILYNNGANTVTFSDTNKLLNHLTTNNNFDSLIINDQDLDIPLESLVRAIKKTTKNKIHLINNNQKNENIFDSFTKVFIAPFSPNEFTTELASSLYEKEQSQNKQDCNILIVEDDKAQQFLLKRILMKLEYLPHTVNDGKQALDWIEKNEVDVIFMDCIMPGMGGIEATTIIRNNEINQRNKKPVTIIGATALTSEEEQKSCIAAGMDHVISKPYKTDEIIKAIKKYAAFQKNN